MGIITGIITGIIMRTIALMGMESLIENPIGKSCNSKNISNYLNG
jgi:hypothetical protein